MNTDAPWPSLDEARARVLDIQTKLHQWSTDDEGRRFDDLFNLVTDPAFLTVAWERVRGNRGARSAGVDGIAPRSIVFGDSMLSGLRAELKAQTFEPLPVKERMIPKASGKLRRLGIPAVRVPGWTGVFVDRSRSAVAGHAERKIASIGVGIRRWVTFHGFALNVSLDLAGFDAIVPCGLAGIEMTSVARELEREGRFEPGRDGGLDQRVRESVAREMEQVLGGHGLDADASGPFL